MIESPLTSKILYPIYIPSLSRAHLKKTAHIFDTQGIPYYLVVEPHQLKEYKEKFKGTILPLPKSGMGCRYAREFIYNHSKSLGAKYHWQFDDNIANFYVYKNGVRVYVHVARFITEIEKYTTLYANIGVCGAQYMGLAITTKNIAKLNTHIYSNLLINNNIGLEFNIDWNIDSSLCIQSLYKGYCTIRTNKYLIDKAQSMTDKGGNTDSYQGNGRTIMAQALKDAFPQVVTIVKSISKKYDLQHKINWSFFDVKLKKRYGKNNQR